MPNYLHPITNWRQAGWHLRWLGIVALMLCCWMSEALAGSVTHAELVKRFPPPLTVGAKDAAIPVWPIYRQNATVNELVGYVFESVDLAPVPGFSGVPINLLIALDPKGVFLNVEVISHHEPVFLDGLGEAPMFQFVLQYRGLSLNQNIRIGARNKNAENNADADPQVDGITKATASVRIMNQTILAAALKVARKKLGFAEGRDPDRIARVKMDLFEPYRLQQLLDLGLVRHLMLRNKDIEQKFSGTDGASLDADALARPDDIFIDLYLAYVSIPSVGRNLLRPKSWAELRDRLESGDHAILAFSKGRFSLIGDNFVRGTVSDRLVLRQDKLPIEMRDLNLDLKLADQTGLSAQETMAFRIISQSGLDPSRALNFSLAVTRAKGIIYPERITKIFPIRMELPARFYRLPNDDGKSWHDIWNHRQSEIGILVAALALLAIALLMEETLTADGRRFAWFRRGFLLFTVLFIGWFAQAQLSIVNLTGLLQAAMAGRSLSFFLYDPMTVVLWGFVAVSLVAWGRGTFCGWLCPFGALQEFTGKLGQALRLPQWKISSIADAHLKWIKYVLLSAILGSTLFARTLTDALVEIEPFKTAITLNFVRSWPYVLYAAGLLLLSSFSYKFYCRYVCPFGAGLAILGRLRVFDWLPRRKECGAPCQTCRHQCEYHAIQPTGEISYPDCFQCMDCVVIYRSDQKCAPLMLEKKKAGASRAKTKPPGQSPQAPT